MPARPRRSTSCSTTCRRIRLRRSSDSWPSTCTFIFTSRLPTRVVLTTDYRAVRLLDIVHAGRLTFYLLPPHCAAHRGQSMPRSLGSRACSFSACSGSAITQGRPVARACAAGHVAFLFCLQSRRPELVLRSSIPGPPIHLSTLRPPPHDAVRET